MAPAALYYPSVHDRRLHRRYIRRQNIGEASPFPGTLPTPPIHSPLHHHLRHASRLGKILLGDQQVTLLCDPWRVAKPGEDDVQREFALEFGLSAGPHRMEQSWPTRRRQRGAGGASFRCVDSNSSNPSLCWLPLDIAVQRPRIRSRARRLERLVEEWVQRVYLHQVQWDRKNSAICRFPIWPAVVFSTRSTSSSSFAIKLSSLISKNINAASRPTRLFPSTNG